MSLTGALTRGRAAAETRMTDACTARRGSGTVYDDTTGTTTPTWTDLYAGACRLKQPSAQAGAATVGEAQVLLQQPELHLPVSAAMLRPGDEVTITGSATDPALPGRVFHIRAVPADSQVTARRYGVTERLS